MSQYVRIQCFSNHCLEQADKNRSHNICNLMQLYSTTRGQIFVYSWKHLLKTLSGFVFTRTLIYHLPSLPLQYAHSRTPPSSTWPASCSKPLLIWHFLLFSHGMRSLNNPFHSDLAHTCSHICLPVQTEPPIICALALGAVITNIQLCCYCDYRRN